MAKFVDATGAEVKSSEAPSVLDTSGIPKEVLAKAEIPMYGPGGAILVKKDELAKAIGAGYTYDSPQDQLKRSFDEKYIEGGVNTAKTLLGSAASGATFGLSDVAGRALDKDYAEITAARREAMPGVNIAGQIVGGIGTAVLGPGAALLGGARAAGKGIAQEVIKGALRKKIVAGGLAETTAGIAGAGAAEGLLQGAGQGVSQAALTQGPIDAKEAAETILMSAGIGAVLGAQLEVAGSAGAGALRGSLKKLFKGSEEQAAKTGAILGKADAADVNLGDELVAGASKLKDNVAEIDAAAKTLGLDPDVDLTPGFKTTSKLVRDQESELAKLNSLGGRKFGRKYERIYETSRDALDNNVLKEVKDLKYQGDLDSENAFGKKIVEDIKSEIGAKYKPLSDSYDQFYKATANIKPDEGLVAKYTDNFLKNDIIELDPTGPLAKQAEKLADMVKRAKNPEQLSKIRTLLGGELDLAYRAGDTNKIGVLKNIKSNLTELRAEVLSKAVMDATADKAEAQILVGQLKNLDKAYAETSDILGSLVEGAKIKGKTKGGVLRSLDKLTPEKVADRFFNIKDADSIALLKKDFPKIYEQLRLRWLSNVRQQSLTGDMLDVGKFLKNTSGVGSKGMSGEARKFILGETAEKVRNAVDVLHRARPVGPNVSNTASTLLNAGVDVTQAARGGSEGITGLIADVAYKQARDYAKYMAINGMGAIEQGIIKRGKTVDQAINAFFERPKLARGLQSGSKMAAIVPIINSRDTKNTQNLDYVAELATNPTKLVDQMDKNMGNLKFVAPELYEIVQERGARAVKFLESKMPKRDPGGPLDKTPKQYSDAELAKYSRYVRAIQNPNSIIEDFGNYALMPEAVETVREIFPEVYNKIAKQVFNKLSTYKEPLTLAQKQQASIMLGFPVSSQLTPQFIQTMQQKYKAPGAENTNAPATAGQPSATGMKQFDLSTRAQTGMERVLSR